MEVLSGHVTGLIGPNGAGKTTIVNLITGLLALDTGRVTLDTVDLTRLEPYDVARAGVSRTFQNVRLLREATVEENLLAGFYLQDTTSLIAKCLGLPRCREFDQRSRKACTKLLEQFSLGEYAALLASELPYGVQRRIEILRAMVMNPRVLLLDEPCAGMNDAEAQELGKLFRGLAESGVAVMLIEHNVALVMDVCDRIYVLRTGELIASGAPAEVRANPDVIEAYLGTSHA
jgi:branched-chain amino acid transport system ATP-binding protein